MLDRYQRRTVRLAGQAGAVAWRLAGRAGAGLLTALRSPAVAAHRVAGAGYTGSMNLLYRYITQGRAESDRPHLSPKSVTRLLFTRPTRISDDQGRCPAS